MTEEEYKKKLNPERYRVMREGGTEVPFTGKYWDNDKSGTYTCAICGNKLFSSDAKFDGGNGWPNFHKPIALANLEYKARPDSVGRTEVRCKKCHSNIGYLSGEKGHYTVYSIALNFEESNRLALLQDIKGKLEDVKEKIEEKNEETDKNDQPASTLDSATAWINSAAQYLAGGAIGVLAGAAGAFLLCQTFCPVPQIPSSQLNTFIATTSLPAPVATTTATTTPPRATTPLPTQTPNVIIPIPPTSTPTTTPGGTSTTSTSSTP